MRHEAMNPNTRPISTRIFIPYPDDDNHTLQVSYINLAVWGSSSNTGAPTEAIHP